MTITKKQICLLFMTVIPSTKLLILPTVYAHYAAQDAWLAGAINLILDAMLLVVLLAVIKKFNGKTFFEVLELSLGKWVARAVYMLYAVYFAISAVLPVFEHKMFIEITLYETAPSVLTFLPFFLISFYFSLKGINATARTGEILFFLTASAFLLITFLSLGSARPYYLRPMLKNPVFRTLKASYSGLLWHGQPLMLLFFAGRIKTEKRFSLSVITSFAAAAFICVFMYALFTCIYGDIAVRQIYALTKMTKYAIALSNVGRFDYVATLLVTAGATLTLSLPFVLAVDCFTQAIGRDKRLVPALALNLSALVLVAIYHMRFRTVMDLFEKFFIPAMIALVYILPTCTLLLRRTSQNAPLCKE